MLIFGNSLSLHNEVLMEKKMAGRKVDQFKSSLETRRSFTDRTRTPGLEANSSQQDNNESHYVLCQLCAVFMSIPE